MCSQGLRDIGWGLWCFCSLQLFAQLWAAWSSVGEVRYGGGPIWGRSRAVPGTWLEAGLATPQRIFAPSSSNFSRGSCDEFLCLPGRLGYRSNRLDESFYLHPKLRWCDEFSARSDSVKFDDMTPVVFVIVTACSKCWTCLFLGHVIGSLFFAVFIVFSAGSLLSVMVWLLLGIFGHLEWWLSESKLSVIGQICQVVIRMKVTFSWHIKGLFSHCQNLEISSTSPLSWSLQNLKITVMADDFPLPVPEFCAHVLSLFSQHCVSALVDMALVCCIVELVSWQAAVTNGTMSGLNITATTSSALTSVLCECCPEWQSGP